jgi:tetratricopeptide (TPR) repeat protein
MPNRLSRFCEGVMEAAWLLGLILTPLFFNIFSSRVFEPDKITLLRSLALLTLAAWLVKLVSEGGPRFSAAHSRSATLRGFVRVPLVLPVAGLVVVYLIATIFSVSPQASLWGSYQRLQGTFTTFSYLVLFAAVAGNLRRRAQVERALTVAIISSLPVSLYGIIQHYRLDPLPWGGDTTLRVTANMGNAIFLAAYLIMTAPIALGRVVTSFHGILTDDDPRQLPFNVTRAALYIFIFSVNLVAIWHTGSRGPWLGLLAGFFFFFVLLSLHWRARALTLGTIGLAALLAVFLGVLNIPSGPLENIRQMPGIGRLGQVFETEGGTGRVRVLIWQGVVELMTPHTPLETPDGSPDRWNALRPLIGYGPEALYVAFNRFYPPDLAHYEARNASPDRSHNETFDALAFTGLLGLAVYMALFVMVFYYALRWLGLITTARRRNIFLGLVTGGGLVTAIAFILWQGPEFFGVGLPFGMLLGLLVFLTLYAVVGLPRGGRPEAAPAPAGPEPWRAIALIGLLSAIVAHFTEIHFGIAIVSTRTHFWVYAGLMFVLGYMWPSLPPEPEASAAESPARQRRRGRASPRIASAPDKRPAGEEWGPVLVGAMLTGALLITLGFDFLTNNNRSTEPGRILVDALTTLPTSPPGERHYAILGLMLITWLGGGALALLEEPQTMRGGRLWSTLAAGLGLSFVVTLIGWIAMTSHLANIASIQPQNLEELIASANAVAGTLTVFYVLVALVLLGLAVALIIERPLVVSGRAPGRGRGMANQSPLAILSYIVLPLAAPVLAVILNMQVIQADVIYKTGLQFDDGGQPQAAIPLFERALDLAPTEDYYYLFLGRAYLNATNAIADEAQRDVLLRDAEQQLHVARRLNPFNTDHTANLARLNRRWAELTSDPVLRVQRAQNSHNYYAQAIRLSPANAGLWNEWAALAFQVNNDPATAQEKLDQSFALDTLFDQTYLLQGDLYATLARQAADPESQQALFQQAIDTYLAGLVVAEERNTSGPNLRLNLAQAYLGAGRALDAIGVYQQVLERGDPGVNPWQVYLAISELYAQLGDLAQARAYAEFSLQSAPDGDKPSIQAWLDQLPP